MVAEFMEFEKENVIDKTSELRSMVIDVNDDLQDEIGERRSQFMALMNTIDDVEEELGKVLVTCLSALALGGVALCAAVASMIL